MNNKKIVWLASYPKSGNTWFRAFLTALQNDGKVDINDMRTHGIFSGRTIFEDYTDLDSTYLYDEEAKNLLTKVYSSFAEDSETIKYIKVHDAFTYNRKGHPIIPEEVTKCAVYLIRNPLDIAGSLANHNGSSIDQAISLINNPTGTFAIQPNNLNTNSQFRQLMLSWSEHVKSWTSITAFPVIIIRYEDMLSDTFNTVKKVLPYISSEQYTDEQIISAIQASSFNELKKQEISNGGFKEANKKSKQFFRAGKQGNWEKELNEIQVEEILTHHCIVMSKYKYV
jgi:hypothetical protein